MPQTEPEIVILEELQLVLNKILDHIKFTRGISALDLDADYYWRISQGHVFDMSREVDASSIDVGSLYEDWRTIRRLVLTENQPLSINLAMISTLLRYVGETVADVSAPKGG